MENNSSDTKLTPNLPSGTKLSKRVKVKVNIKKAISRNVGTSSSRSQEESDAASTPKGREIASAIKQDLPLENKDNSIDTSNIGPVAKVEISASGASKTGFALNEPIAGDLVSTSPVLNKDVKTTGSSTDHSGSTVPVANVSIAKIENFTSEKNSPAGSVAKVESNESKETPSSSTGTKLAKRVKVKVNVRNAISRNIGKNEPNIQGGNSTSGEALITNKDKAVPTANDNNQNKNVEIKSNENDTSKTDIVVSSPSLNTENKSVKVEAQSRDSIKNEFSNEKSGSDSSKTPGDKPDLKKLSKRLKINPKITARNTPRTTAASTTPCNSENNKPENPQGAAGDVGVVSKAPTVDSLMVEKKESENAKEEVQQSIDGSSKTKDSYSKLQKRKKVMPNLVIPSKVQSKEDVPQEKALSSDIGVEAPSTSSVVDTPNPKGDVALVGPSSSIETSDSARKSKHVHFESTGKSEDVDKPKDHVILNEVRSTDTSNKSESPSTSKQQSILKKDNYDYSSQSEGESSHSTSLSRGKKIFRPNLGARRRKRLSSFSAYSSCDDENEDGGNENKDEDTFRKKAEAESGDEAIEEEKTSQKRKEKSEKGSTSKGKEKKSKRRKKTDKENEEVKDSDEDDDVVEEKPKKKIKRTNRKICTEERDISTLTMQELIFYRPKSLKKVELRADKLNNDMEETATILPNVEEKVDMKGKKEDFGSEGEDESMAPQVMLDENGEVVINNESLTIRKKVDDSQLKKTGILYENSLSSNNHRRKVSKIKRWKLHETLRFYKALSQIGTDFTLMSQAFGRFTRNELKKKFKQEEKVNCDLVDMALSNRLPLNMEVFLRGKEEMQQILDEEINGVSSTMDDNKKVVKTRKKSVKEEISEVPKDNLNEIRDCTVRIEPAKIDEALLRQKDTVETDEEADGPENYTDFQRTSKIRESSDSTKTTTTTTTTESINERKTTKRRRLQIIDDSDDDDE